MYSDCNTPALLSIYFDQVQNEGQFALHSCCMFILSFMLMFQMLLASDLVWFGITTLLCFQSNKKTSELEACLNYKSMQICLTVSVILFLVLFLYFQLLQVMNHFKSHRSLTSWRNLTLNCRVLQIVWL